MAQFKPVQTIELRYCPVYPLKLYGFDDKNIYTIETEILETSYAMEECHVVWLGGKYTRIPVDSFFLSPTNNPSRHESYNRECCPPDVYYGSKIVDLVHRHKVEIFTPKVRPLHITVKSGPIYLHIVTLES